MKDQDKPQCAIALARISYDRLRDQHGVDDQETYLGEFGESLGWNIRWVIKENDTSAYLRTRSVPDGEGGFTKRTNRPVFRKVLRMLASGEADGLIVRDLDRAVRDPRDLEDLIDVVESRTPLIPVRSIRGTLDLSSPSGIMVARMFAAKANEDSRIHAARVADTKRLRAQEGKFRGGPRPYGFQKDGMTLIQAEVNEIVMAADAVLDGESLTNICRFMNERGIPTSGKRNRRTAGQDKQSVWGVVGLRQILMRPRNAGLIDRHGEIIGKAKWDPIISEEKWRAVCAILSDPSRRVSPGPKPKHLGTNIYFCGVCLEEYDDEVFMIGQRTDYRCKEYSHFHRKKAPIDERVVSKIVKRLATPEAAGLLQNTRKSNPDQAKISAESANIRRKLRELDESYKAGRISIGRYELVAAGLEEHLARNEKASRVSLEEDPLAGIAGNPDAAVIWAGLPVYRQRAIIRDLVEVVLYPQKNQPNQHTPFDPESIEVYWLK